MVGDLLARFAIGGALVSLFALAGDLFKPKTFAGLFGAAPSVVVFALVAWGVPARVASPLALGAATVAWAIVAVLVWAARKHMAYLPYGPRLLARHSSRRSP